MFRKIIIISIICFLSFVKSQGQIIRDEWLNCGNGNCLVYINNYIVGTTYTWEGQCKNNKANGSGILKEYHNNELYSTFTGNMNLGLKTGLGKLTYSNGTILTCTFIKNQANGEGKFVLENGTIYEGNIINGNAHGYCHQTLGNGSQFDGFVVNGNFYEGKYIDPTGKIYFYEKGAIIKKRHKETSFNFEIGTKLTLYYDEEWKICFNTAFS
jgi:hypothetical protein